MDGEAENLTGAEAVVQGPPSAPSTATATATQRGMAMSEDARPRGLIDRIVGAYWDFSGSTRALLADRPSDATLLSFMLLAAFVSLCGDIAAQSFARSGPWTDAELDVLTSQIVGRLLVGPLGLYLVSALVGAIARGFGGGGGWYETRVAMAWSLLVAAPWTFTAQLVAGGLGATFAAAGAETAWIATAATAPLLGTALYIWGACLAGAHGFSSPRLVVGVAIALVAGVVGGSVVLARLFGA